MDLKAALERERDGYLRAGQKDRAALVDAELKKLGKKDAPAPQPVADEPETASVEKPEETRPARRGRKPKADDEKADSAD